LFTDISRKANFLAPLASNPQRAN
jgi:hypothetical protein